MKSPLLLLGLSWLVLLSVAKAQDTLCYALVTVPKQEAPIVRHEMAAATANHFADGEDFFTSTRGARRLFFLGKVDMAGKERIEMNRYLPPSMTYGGPWTKDDLRVSITTVRSGEGREALLTVDAGVLVQGQQATDPKPGKDHFTRYAATSQVPLRPNVWQEVAFWSTDHFCQMLWQYALVKDAPKSATVTAVAPADSSPSPLYRLEMIIGRLPVESFSQLPTSSAERRAMIAESYQVHAHKWTAISVHCLPEQNFTSRIARGLAASRSKDPDYEAGCSSTFSGTLETKLGCVALKSEFRPAAPKPEDRRVTPLAADLVPGEWHIQRIEEEPVIYDFGNSSIKSHEMVNGRVQGVLVRANAAFFRVVEVKR